MKAPIALFAYSRLGHLKRTVEALQANQESSQSDLIVFSDAAKTPDKQSDVDEVRKYIKECHVCKNYITVLKLGNYTYPKYNL